jgi:UDP-N-acetylmuramoyl-L-alanyl-D-glutamate--2,6-diaminopimelate ligase
MTNKVSSCLAPYLKKENNVNFEELNQLTSYLDKADDKTIAFYRLSSDPKSKEIFEKRLEQSSAGCVIVLGDYNHSKVISVGEEDFEKLQINLANAIYPLKDIKIIGVTGTNGKTSTVSFITEILKQNKIPVATLGTLGLLENGDLVHDFKMTTPGYIELRRGLSLLSDNVKVLAMEVSSHGLEQKRLGDLKLDIAGWTNFTQDHLDYHKSMEEYFKAKAKILNYTKRPLLIPHNLEIMNLLEEKKIPHKKVISFDKLKLDHLNSYFDIKYHKENFELAYGLVSEVLGINTGIDLKEISYPEGRFEIFDIDGRMFVIDYAHTPDALEKLLSEIKNNFSDRKLNVVFGCGGDRDKEKRAIMGKIASRFADSIYLTDDNPRTEDPEVITQMIASAVEKDYKIINNREEAIRTSYAESSTGDIIVIAGKGHEKYQEVNGIRSYFSDQDIVKSLI